MGRYGKIRHEKNSEMVNSSSDSSAIGIIWSIIKRMLNLFSLKIVEDLKSSIKKILESIPTSIYERKIEHIKKRWELCIKQKGGG